MTKIIYIEILLVWLCTQVNSQVLTFKNYSISDGLSQNSIYSITQSKDGFMWFGSQAGLNRFDGSNFKVLVPIIKDKNVVNTDYSKMITALYNDQKDLIWVGTTNELLLYNARKNKWSLPEDIYPGFKIIPLAWVLKLSEDDQGKIWISTLKKGMFCYDKNKKTMLQLPIEVEKSKPNVPHCNYKSKGICTAKENHIYILNDKLIEDLDVNKMLNSRNNIVNSLELVHEILWFIVNGNSVFNYDLKNRKLTNLSSSVFKGHVLNDYNTLYYDNKNTIWLGSRTSGISKININNYEIVSAKASKEEQSLKKNFILSTFCSKDGIMWIGTSGGGISKFEGDKQGIDLYRVDSKENPNAIYDNMILSIYTENEQDLYMGTLYGGLLKYNIQNRTFHYFTPNENEQISKQSYNMYTVVKGNSNLLWMATWGGLYSFDKSTKVFKKYGNANNENTRELSCLIKLKLQNNLLVSSSKGIPLLFNLKSNTFEPLKDPQKYLSKHILRIRYIEERENADLYFATENESLVRYNYVSGIFYEYPKLHSISGVCRHFVFNKGLIWAGTEDGLACVNPLDGSIIKLIGIKDGLPDNVIYGVLLDINNYIWVSTNKGIARIDEKNNQIVKFNLEDNLQDMEFNTASVLKFSSGKLFFGGINGFNVIDPLNVQVTRTIPTPIINEIKVLNEQYNDSVPYPYLNKITLKHKENFITIGFQSPVYSQTGNINYKYLLSDIDKTWIDNGSRNYVNFTQLKPGDYIFQVKAYDGNKLESSIKTLTIHVIGPWYQSFWFLSLVFVSLIGITYAVIHARISAIKARKSLLHQKAEAEMQSLRLQMNPHFIFNSLNSINSFVIEHKINFASDYLTKFSRLMRLILENSKQDSISIEKELESIKLYLLMESLRFNHSFKYKIEVDENVYDENILIPPLIVQPYIENAIWHGLMHKENEGSLFIYFHIIDKFLHISIQDNGVGRIKSQEFKARSNVNRKSHGMEITKNRLHYHNSNNSVEIIDITDDFQNPLGTRVEIKIFIQDS